SKPLFYQNFFGYFDAYMIDYGGAYELGRVEVSFHIEVDGKLSDVKIRKSTYPEVDYFVVKMISEMPRWQPAMMFGQFVKVQYTMPVVFNSGYKKNAIRKEAQRKQ